ncbi:C2 calcium-dependent domain-containing protein 4C-like [Rhinatrema bivittatum]|uniref:C2 calcium-dependent domain-containing protein 4C-like n=1 Tax=Rhinatrema bivittatum TaxID=194408 RepID=UPI001128B8D0|nr:C2 calcium-dependent domain-containing protein 4C-like [Rhinatrema bivittatum]
MLSATTQLSIKSALESMLTWTAFKTEKPATEDKLSQRNKDIFNIVMTPDRIPKFFIPPLDVGHIFLHETHGADSDNLSPDRDISHEMPMTPRPKRSNSDSYIKKESMHRRKALCKKISVCSTDTFFLPIDLERAADHSDPATRAALSLPHLPKITTPYGFLTLGESPNIRRKESLFFEHDSASLRALLSQRRKSPAATRSSSNPRNPTAQQRRSTEPPVTPNKTGRSVSWEAICTNAPPSPLSADSKECTIKYEKKRFQSLMKKHFSGIIHMQSNSRAVDKFLVPLGRTRSSPIA